MCALEECGAGGAMQKRVESLFSEDLETELPAGSLGGIFTGHCGFIVAQMGFVA